MSSSYQSALAIAVAICLCACQSKSEQTAIKAIANYTRDPSSVQVRNVHEEPDLFGKTTICGEFNAKNRFGGYAGFAHFAVLSDSPDIAIEADSNTPHATEWIDGLCNPDSPYHSAEAQKALFAAELTRLHS